MAKYIQKISFGIEGREWWVGWDIAGPIRHIQGLISADSLSPEDLRARGVSSFQPVNAELLARLERRTIQRVRLIRPLKGKTGSVPVEVVDISAGGIGICHETPLRPGKPIEVAFMADDRFYSMKFDLLRCQLSRGYVDHGAARYYSALRLCSADPSERNALPDLVASILAANESAIRENLSRALALE